MSPSSTASPHITVGKYFLDRGKISAHQLDLALKHQAEFGLKIGQSLVELGFVSESDMVDALRHQARFPCIHLTRGIVDARLASKLGEGTSRRLRVIALNQIANHATVAMSDPSDAAALEELGQLLGTRIFPVYAQPSLILELIDSILGTAGKPASEKAPARTGQPAGRSELARVKDRGATSGPPEAAPDEKAVVERVRAILQGAFEQGASDIHLEARSDGLCVRYRSEGSLREGELLPSSWAGPTIACLRALASLEEAEDTEPSAGCIPFLYKKQHYDVFISTTPSLHGESAVLRIHTGETRVFDLAGLGLTEGQRSEVSAALSPPRGLVLATGPCQSGRTTTLYALVSELLRSDRKVVTLERKSARALDGALQVKLDAEDDGGVAAELHELRRQDPDVILLDEIVGRESARSALEMALDGCLVLTTLRSPGALQTFTRLVSLGLEAHLLADGLRAVVAQRLVHRVCPDCAVPRVPDEALRLRLALPQDGEAYQDGTGCEACRGSGHGGRAALFEVLALTPELRRALESGGADALIRGALSGGFQELREHGLTLARAGAISLREVLLATY